MEVETLISDVLDKGTARRYRSACVDYNNIIMVFACLPEHDVVLVIRRLPVSCQSPSSLQTNVIDMTFCVNQNP